MSASIPFRHRQHAQALDGQRSRRRVFEIVLITREMATSDPMPNSNPFAPPGAIVADTADQARLTSSRRQSLTTGRRLLVASIVGFVACAVMRRTGPGGLQLLLGFVTLVAAITGIVKVCLATELGWGVTALALVGFFIPFLNIAVYVTLIARATRELRSPRTAWYQVDAPTS